MRAVCWNINQEFRAAKIAVFMEKGENMEFVQKLIYYSADSRCVLVLSE